LQSKSVKPIGRGSEFRTLAHLDLEWKRKVAIFGWGYEFGLQEYLGWGWKGVFERKVFQLLMDWYVI
jgi:hypothetical protein